MFSKYKNEILTYANLVIGIFISISFSYIMGAWVMAFYIISPIICLILIIDVILFVRITKSYPSDVRIQAVIFAMIIPLSVGLIIGFGLPWIVEDLLNPY